MGQERRKYPRLARPIAATWRGASGASACRITDISLGGCFIQTLAAPLKGERTIVSVPGEGRSVEISGTIAYVEKAIGFGVQFDMEFDDLSAEQIEALTGLLGENPLREKRKGGDG